MKSRITIILLLITSLSFGGTVGNYTSMTNSEINWASVLLGNELSVVASQIASVVEWDPQNQETNSIGENAGSGSLSSTSRWTIAEMQQMISSEYDELWFGTDTLQGKTNVYALSALGGTGAYEDTFPIADFFSHVGMSSNGFRKATTNYPTDWTDVDDAHYTYGIIAAGDIVGPWNVDDIQRCFDGMTQSVTVATWVNDGTNYVQDFGQDPSDPDWSNAVSVALSAYGGANRSTVAASLASYSYGEYFSLGTYYKAFFAEYSPHVRVETTGAGVNRSIDVYFRVGDSPVTSSDITEQNEFNSNGYPVVYHE